MKTLLMSFALIFFSNLNAYDTYVKWGDTAYTNLYYPYKNGYKYYCLKRELPDGNYLLYDDSGKNIVEECTYNNKRKHGFNIFRSYKKNRISLEWIYYYVNGKNAVLEESLDFVEARNGANPYVWTGDCEFWDTIAHKCSNVRWLKYIERSYNEYGGLDDERVWDWRSDITETMDYGYQSNTSLNRPYWYNYLLKENIETQIDSGTVVMNRNMTNGFDLACSNDELNCVLIRGKRGKDTVFKFNFRTAYLDTGKQEEEISFEVKKDARNVSRFEFKDNQLVEYRYFIKKKREKTIVYCKKYINNRLVEKSRSIK